MFSYRIITSFFGNVLKVSRTGRPVQSTLSPLEKIKRRPRFDVLEDRTAPSATAMSAPQSPPPQGDSEKMSLVGAPNNGAQTGQQSAAAPTNTSSAGSGSA